MRIHAVLAVLGTLTFGVSTASALPVNFTGSFTPTTSNIGYIDYDANSGPEKFSGNVTFDAPGSVGLGDTYNLTYTFGGYGISGTFNNALIWANTDGPEQYIWTSGTLSLLDAVGGVIDSADWTSPDSSIYSSSAYYNIGPYWFLSFPDVVTTVYGIMFSGTIDAVEGYPDAADAGPRTYTWGNFTLNGTGDLELVAPVPVPAALPLLAVGLGALGFMGWRKKRAAAPLAA